MFSIDLPVLETAQGCQRQLTGRSNARRAAVRWRRPTREHRTVASDRTTGDGHRPIDGTVVRTPSYVSYWPNWKVRQPSRKHGRRNLESRARTTAGARRCGESGGSVGSLCRGARSRSVEGLRTDYTRCGSWTSTSATARFSRSSVPTVRASRRPSKSSRATDNAMLDRCASWVKTPGPRGVVGAPRSASCCRKPATSAC